MKKSILWGAGLILMAGLLGVFRNFSDAKSEVQNEIAAVPVQVSELRKHVQRLTSTDKSRDFTHPEVLNEIASYIYKTWEADGLRPQFQEFVAGGKTYKNVLVSLGPEKASRIVIGAHYDVAGEQAGADDNASGVAGILELARLLTSRAPLLKHRIDLVAYCLEEPPFFATSDMGSAVHARSLRDAGVKVRLMMSLEMIGYFTEKEGSQSYPLSVLKYIYPSKGNFIAVVGQLTAVGLVQKVRKLMAANSKVDVQFINAPRSLVGVDFSDHRNYWEQGYPAVMVTDTAFLRNPNYHSKSDTIETLSFPQMAEVVEGVYAVAVGF
jgi:Zn-dependent M28 family amino/carboxypeptidase